MNKQQLIDSFTELTLSDEMPELSTNKEVDLFSFYKELVELRSEIKQQSRLVKTSLTDFKSMLNLLKQQNEQLTEQMTNDKQLHAQQLKQATKSWAMQMIEYMDYLKLSLTALEKTPSNSWIKRSNNRKNTSFIEGQKLLISRFNALLINKGIKAFEVHHHSFAPQRMCAKQTKHDSQYDEGLVLEELLTGYTTMDGDILRLAHVVVNKRGIEQ